MPREQTKGKQPSVEPEEDIGEGSSGETSGELVPSTAIRHSSIPGFSAVQVHGVNSMINQMTTMMDVKIQAQSQRFEAQIEASQSSFLAAIQQMQQSMQQMQQSMQQMQQSFAAGNAENPQQNAPATQQHSQPVTPQPTDDKRWRPEEIGQYNGTGDVYAFTDRIASIAELKGPKLIQTNLVTVLKGVAFNWYHYELTDVVKWALNTSESINPWCQALIERFRPTQSELISQLESTRYTRKDAANKRDATAYIQDLMRISKGLNWNQSDGLMTAFHHFDPSLQRDLDPPIDLNQFIRQVQLRQSAWFQIYAGYGSSKPQPSRPSSFLPAKSPQQQSYRPSYPNQSNQLRQITDKSSNGPPRVYWASQEEEEDYNDYTYDAPSDAWIAAPDHGPGHTPRRWGNTHDVGGSEAVANWTSAGEDHRCTHHGCTHYH